MPHLVLSRKLNERFRLMTTDGPIWITVAKIKRGQAVLGIEAPESVVIAREELIEDEAGPEFGEKE